MSKFNWSNPPYKIKKDGTQYTKVWRDKNHVFFKKVVDTDNINSMH